MKEKRRKEAVKPAVSKPAAAPWQQIAGFALLVLSTVLAYVPALTGAILWDDNMHVTRPELRSLHGLWRIWFDLPATQQYYPLLHSAFWVEHRLWGDAVMGYHLTNVLLHAASACLLVVILRRLRIPGAWLAGFIFALHPVAVEGVAWISEQKSTMSGFFYMASALTYLHFDESRRRRTWWFALALFALALMSKSVTATLPAALLVIFWWQRGRIEPRRDVLPLAPWFVVGICSGLLTAWVERSPNLIGAQGTQYALSMGQRLLLAGRIPWFYAWKDVWPWPLMFTYPHWDVSTGDALQFVYPLALLAVAAAFVWLARRSRGPLAALLFFVGTLFPALGFLNVFPFRYSYVADHFQYLALLGIIVPAAAGFTLLARRFALNRNAALAISAALLVALAAFTRAQSANYRDYETLFRATLKHNTGSSFVHSNLGVILMSSGREAEAAKEFEDAVRLTPNDATYRVNYGLALAQMPGRLNDAVREYETALKLDPGYSPAHVNLGLAYSQMPGRLQDAVAEYQKAIEQYRSNIEERPDMWQAHFNLGLAYDQMPGHEADAVEEYKAALRLKPDSARAHFNLGNALHKLHRLPEAIAAYQAALAIDPDSHEARYELAYALAQIPGRVPDAIEECRRMLALKPGDAAGQQLLASLVAFQNQVR